MKKVYTAFFALITTVGVTSGMEPPQERSYIGDTENIFGNVREFGVDNYAKAVTYMRTVASELGDRQVLKSKFLQLYAQLKASREVVFAALAIIAFVGISILSPKILAALIIAAFTTAMLLPEKKSSNSDEDKRKEEGEEEVLAEAAVK